jgi:hypothetical protein
MLQAMALITPLRRICSGGRFTAAELAPKDIVVHHLPGRAGAVPLELADSGLAAPEDQECVVCLDEMENPVVTPCHHWFWWVTWRNEGMGLCTSVCCGMRIAEDYVAQKYCSVAASRTGPLGACPDIPSEAAPWSLAIHSHPCCSFLLSLPVIAAASASPPAYRTRTRE